MSQWTIFSEFSIQQSHLIKKSNYCRCIRGEGVLLILLYVRATTYILLHVLCVLGGGPRVVVSTAAFHARVRGSVPGLGGLKETKMFLPHPRVKVSIVGSLRDREVACSASDRQGLNFESCVWRTVSSQSSHHPQEVLLAQFSLYVHKGGLKPDSFHFLLCVLHTVQPSHFVYGQLGSSTWQLFQTHHAPSYHLNVNS